MIDFVVLSFDLQPYVLDTWVKKRTELSNDHHLVASVVRVYWECLLELFVWEVLYSHIDMCAI